MPIVALSCFDDPALIQHAYNLGVNSYLVKAATYEDLEAQLESVVAFWTVAWQHSHSPLTRRPLVLFDRPRAEVQIQRQAYDLGANAFITKPVSLPEFLDLIAEVLRFWVMLAALLSRQTV